MESRRMEVSKENIRAATPRPLPGFVDLLDGIAVVGLAREASRIFAKEGRDVAPGRPTACPDPTQRFFFRNLGPNLDSGQLIDCSAGSRDDALPVKFVELSADCEHLTFLPPLRPIEQPRADNTENASD